MNLLFWNIRKNDVSGYVCECIKENDVDIAAFAEHDGLDFAALAKKLGDEYQVHLGKGGCEKVRVIARRGIDVAVRIEQTRYIIVRVHIGGVTYVMCFLHMKDRINYDSHARARDGEQIMGAIENVAENAKCNNIVLMGDFNANPYDDEMLLPYSFNAVLFKDVIAKSETCVFDEKRYRRLYNPVLNYLSEDSKTYGSHYFLPGGKAGPIWNCLDMVLVSKSLVDKIATLEYLKAIGKKSLMKIVKPNADISDHLPLFVRIG